MSRVVAGGFIVGLATGALVAGLATEVPADDALRTFFLRPAPHAASADPARVALGRTLFFDGRLSASGTLSCAGCHDPDRAWQDGRPRAVGESGAVGRRRTPSLIDAGHNETFFWDGRARSLEEQVLRPIQEPVEMNRPLDSLVAWLRESADYRERFRTAYGDRPIGPETLADALASFVRTIESGESAFDRWAAGDAAALNEPAKQGFALFVGKANCAVCHSGWRFTDEAFHNIGLPMGSEPADLGRGPVIGVARANHAFRTPTLRDVARRPPYMHDGSVATLRAVVDHYAEGIVNRPTLSDDLKRIELSAAERDALVAFLEALNTERPVAPGARSAAPASANSIAQTKVQVTQRQKTFSARELHLARHGRLEILNEDTTTHNIQVFDPPRLEFNSGAQEPGETVLLTFAAPGRYTVFCGIHPKMKLRVIAD